MNWAAFALPLTVIATWSSWHAFGQALRYSWGEIVGLLQQPRSCWSMRHSWVW
ncbi:hypothetical protein [Mycobacterium sp. NPDC050853]|uniref:hypothetical protein n=1 Tax=Mycobacterium sp. NPDC050853 TaxID=3155160 RepID=UPI0033E10957